MKREEKKKEKMACEEISSRLKLILDMHKKGEPIIRSLAENIARKAGEKLK